MPAAPTEPLAPSVPYSPYLFSDRPHSPYGVAPTTATPSGPGGGVGHAAPSRVAKRDLEQPDAEPSEPAPPRPAPLEEADPSAARPVVVASHARNGLAIWSLVLGCASLVLFGFLAGIPAIILGRRASAAVARGEATNRGVAYAGIVTGALGAVLALLPTVGLDTGPVYSFLIGLTVNL